MYMRLCNYAGLVCDNLYDAGCVNIADKAVGITGCVNIADLNTGDGSDRNDNAVGITGCVTLDANDVEKINIADLNHGSLCRLC